MNLYSEGYPICLISEGYSICLISEGCPICSISDGCPINLIGRLSRELLEGFSIGMIYKAKIFYFEIVFHT